VHSYICSHLHECLSAERCLQVIGEFGASGFFEADLLVEGFLHALGSGNPALGETKRGKRQGHSDDDAGEGKYCHEAVNDGSEASPASVQHAGGRVL